MPREKVNKTRVSETSFNVTPIVDEEILINPRSYILLVHNIADIVVHGRKGKYAAWGFPGGGVNPERLEKREEAAKNEMLGETGLIVDRLIYLYTQPKMIVSNLETEEMIRQFFFEPGRRPSTEINPYFQEAIENPIHIFLTKVKWHGTALRTLFLKKKIEGLRDGSLTVQQITDIGITVDFNQLTEKELEKLEIEEAMGDKKEIDGVGLFSMSFLAEMLKVETEREQKDRKFYLTHMMWLQRALEQMQMVKF